MDLKQLEFIVAIAEEKNISRAAQLFFISPSALSQQLSKLEDELMVSLFDREKYGVKLTPAGEIYVNNARKILAIRDETLSDLREFSKDTKNKIRVLAAPGRSPELFSRVYSKFLTIHPDYNMSIFECSSTDAEKVLGQHKCELIFTMLSQSEEEAGIPFNFEILNRERMLMITSINNPLVAPGYMNPEYIDFMPVRPAQFRYANFVLPSKQTKLRKYIDEIAYHFGLTLKVSYELLNTENICKSIPNSNICTIVSDGFLPRIHDDLAVYLFGENYYMDYCICWPKDHTLKPAEEEFIELCKTEFPNLRK